MEKTLYVMLIERTKMYNKLNKAGVMRHVENIRNLDESGNMELCGVIKGFPGVAGMVIIKADSFEEAKVLCEREPLVVDGFATYKLITMQVVNKENNYLL